LVQAARYRNHPFLIDPRFNGFGDDETGFRTVPLRHEELTVTQIDGVGYHAFAIMD
jgi:hypothetical protein